MRSRWLWIGFGIGLLAVVWGGWIWLEERRFQRELKKAVSEMAGGHYRPVRQRLSELARRRPGSSEAAYQLGLCEENLGHLDSAMATWSSIAAGSPFAIKASIGRARLLMNAGRFAPAEEVLSALPHDRGPDALAVRQALELLLRIEGRVQETRELIVESWLGAPEPSYVLKRIYTLEDTAFPVDYVKQSLKSGDPNDDRVWLARANLAIWSGQFEEAARWLAACEKRRSDDQPVWLARLALAMGARDADGARRAATHIRAAWFQPFEVLRLRAWYAAFLGDDQAERRALTALLAEEPGNSNAWARLAELAVKTGGHPKGHAEAESFRKKQADTSVRRARYASLIKLDERNRHVDELGKLAQELGRPIEARGWSLIQQGRAATEPLWPPNDEGPPPRDPDRRRVPLASLMDDLPPIATRLSPRFATGSGLIPPRFTDDAEEVGLRFFHDNGHTRKNPPPPETMCGGVGLLDYDGDGWLDVFAVQGGPFPPTDPARGEGDRLFRNRGDGTFEDTTERAGIAAFPRGYGHGVAVADYDNDGRPDLFVTRWHSYALYRNRGDGRFEDVTGKVGLGGDRDWPTSAAFADLDSDGDLDLYVCHYLFYDPGNPKRCEHPDSPSNHECIPRDFPSLPDRVFQNDNGRFVDVTAKAGFVDPDGRGLGVVAADLDDDNRIDLYVANDMSANYLFHNLGATLPFGGGWAPGARQGTGAGQGPRFEETGQISGAAVSADGLYKSGMGLACGDLDGDGVLDLAVTNFFGESTTFYRNLGRGYFVDQTAVIGLQAPSRPLLGFGLAFPDVNNDGWLDLLSTNGHVLDGRPRIPLMMPLQLLIGGPEGHLTDVSERAGDPFRPLHLGRGLAVGDLDNDGRLDAVVLNQNEPLVYLHNRSGGAPGEGQGLAEGQSRGGHFIRFSLEGTRSNRDGVGARVTIDCGGRRRVAERVGGGSYQSASDPRLHFGLGESSTVESVDVRWPSGQVDHHARLSADREYRLREGSPLK
jgi:enediyne biosynthesis protein E4